MPVSNISREKCTNKTSTNQTSDCVSRCVSAVDWSESTGLQNMYQFFSSSILLLDHTQNDRKCFNVSNPKTCQNIHIHTSANKLLKHQMFYQPRLTSFSWSVFSRGGGSLGRCTAVKTRAHTHTQTTHAYTHTQTDTQNRKVVGVQLYFKTLSGRGTETVLDAACAIETHAQLTWLAVGGFDCFNLKSSLQPSYHISHSRGWASVDRSTPGSCTICTMISGLQIIDGSYHYGTTVAWQICPVEKMAGSPRYPFRTFWTASSGGVFGQAWEG